MRDGWVETTLGEVAQLTIGKTPPRAISAYWTSDLANPFCTIADMTERSVSPRREGVTSEAIEDGRAKRVPSGSLLMSFKLTIGRVGFAAVDLFPNEAIVWIEPAKELDRRFLALWLDHLDLEEYAGRAVKGKTLNGPSLRAIPVAFPPLAEQRRIVDLIAAVDASIKAAERMVADGTAARAALLSELLAGEGDGWVETTLGEVAEVLMGQSPPGSTYNTKGDGMPFIQGSAEFGARHPQPVQWCSAPKKVAKPGDLLVSVRAPVGDLNFALEAIAVGRGLAVVRGTDDALVEFLGLAIQHALPELRSRAGGGMFESITKQGLLGLEVAVPPLAEQRRIVDLIAAVDDVAIGGQQTAGALRQSRSALLADLLSGTHEIPESYDALLEAVA